MINKKKFLSGIVGNILEYYNLTLYGFLTFHLTPTFFPQIENVWASKIISLATFSVAFISRPFGAVILGALGDIGGHQRALGTAILISSFPSFLICFLPSYVSIGLSATILLLISRFVQGISIGGEYGNAVSYVLKNASEKNQNFVGSLLCASGFLGGIAAAGAAALFTLDYFPDFFWRIPFFIGGCFGLFGYYLRKNVLSATQDQGKSSKSLLSPLKELLSQEKLSLFKSIGIGVVTSAPYYICVIYMNGVYTHSLKFAPSFIMQINTGLLFVWAIMLPFFGKLADKFSRRIIMILSASGILLTGCISTFFLKAPTLSSILTIQILLTLTSVGFLSISNALLKSLFTKTSVSSGISIGYTIGGVIMGGTSPLLIEFASKFISFPVGGYLIFIAFLGFLIASHDSEGQASLAAFKIKSLKA